MSDRVETTFAVSLTIPDNEAFTALGALRRLAIPVAAVRRADIWILISDAAVAPGLAETIGKVETIFNPNKHALDERAAAAPDRGEVWIAARDDTPASTVGGRAIAGVSGIVRRVAWRLLDAAGDDVDGATLDRAVETFLCNPAFQKALR